MQLPKLNFDKALELQIKQDKDTFFIYDPTRKIWLVLTPEEWVRQHWIRYFHKIKKKNYSAIITEQKIVLNGTIKRLDILITEKTKPKILVECKAPEIKLNESHFEQIARYNSEIGAEKIILTNGLHHIFANFIDGEYIFVKN